jgi:hypothetical protein
MIVFYSEAHRKRFTNILHQVNIVSINRQKLAAILLLSVTHSLWQTAKFGYHKHRFDFNTVPTRSLGCIDYTAFKLAQDLCENTDHIQVSDLLDTGTVDRKLFPVFLSAIQIMRSTMTAAEILNKFKNDITNKNRGKTNGQDEEI